MKQIEIKSDKVTHISERYLLVKRLCDIIMSTILLILCSPLLLVLCILLYMDDGFPVIFRQVRIGKDGHPFVIMKLRTMPYVQKIKTGGIYKDKNWQNGVPDAFIFKSSSPSNSTKLGKLLRKFSLDELPQLFNVIKGDMSLIGPRPEVPEITKYYNHEQRERLLVRPGITGYAQIKGRSDLNHGEKIMFDRFYIEAMSWKLDCKILASTVIRVIKPEGNY